MAKGPVALELGFTVESKEEKVQVLAAVTVPRLVVRGPVGHQSLDAT